MSTVNGVRWMVRTSGGSVKVSMTVPAIRSDHLLRRGQRLHRLIELEPEFGRPLRIAEGQEPGAAGPAPFPPQGLAPSPGCASPPRRPRKRRTDRAGFRAWPRDRTAGRALSPPAAAAAPSRARRSPRASGPVRTPRCAGRTSCGRTRRAFPRATARAAPAARGRRSTAAPHWHRPNGRTPRVPRLACAAPGAASRR